MFGIPKDFKLKRELWVFLISIVLVHNAAYLIVPIFPLLLKNVKGLNSVEIGIVIGAGSLFIQLGSIIAGLLADRMGNKLIMLLSNICQAIGLIGMGLAGSYYILVFFSILNGIGTGMYIPTTKAALSYIASEDYLTTVFSLRSVASHIGISISGLLLLFIAANVNFYFAGGIYLLLLILSWLYLPNNCGDQPCPTVPLKSYVKILSNKGFLAFTAISALIWALHTQLSFLLPLRAEASGINSSKIGLIWTITSISVIILQPIISKTFLRRHSLALSILIGALLLGGGVSFLGFSNSFILLVLCSLLFIVGEMLMMPPLDSYTSSLADKKLIGAYFAISNFAAGIGAAAGAFISGRLLNIYSIKTASTPWLIYALYTGVLSLLILFILRPFSKNKKEKL